MKRRSLHLLGLLALIGWAGLTLPAQARRASSPSANKAMVRRFFEEVFNQGKIDQADKYIAVDAVDHQMPSGMSQGLAAFKTMLRSLRSAFPDLRVTVEDVIAEGDKVVVRSTLRGTQTGAMQLGPGSTIPATGKAIMITSIDIIRFAGGKMVEHWGSQDDLGMMQQLGLLPANPQLTPPSPPAR